MVMEPPAGHRVGNSRSSNTVLLFLCSFLLSCTSSWTGPYTDPKFNYWTSKNLNELTSSWGRPDRINTAFNGNWEYVYAARLHTKSQTNDSYCQAIFQVNPDNWILSIREEGNACNKRLTWPGPMSYSL